VNDIRALAPADGPALTRFLARVPAGESTFFKEDVLDSHTVSAWLDDTRARRAVAADASGEILAYAVVLPGSGWSSHVGELGLVVDPGHRRNGLGRRLAQWAVVESVRLGLAKLSVEVVAEQAAAVRMFQHLGFRAEALLYDHVRDREGTTRDLIVLSHQVAENWSLLATIGVGSA
jgi:L-amino acid N-acyltransferase YncA